MVLTVPLRATSKASRLETILRRVSEEGFVSVRVLAEDLDVTEMSIRRDATELEENGLIRRVRGGLVRLEDSTGFPERTSSNQAAKERIARTAAAMVGLDEIVVIDAGTTALAFALALPVDFRGTVISHSLPVLSAMLDRPQVTTFGLGGELYQPSRAFVGSSAVEDARGFRATTFVMGAASVDADGVYAWFGIEREVKSALLGISQRTLLLVDHTKFAVTAPVLLTAWTDSLTLITDRRPAAALVETLESENVTLRIADET